MTKAEIIAEIKKQVKKGNQDPEYDLEIDGVTIETVTRKGGEDQGSEYYVVLKVTPNNEASFLVLCSGYYSSYEGVEWLYGDVYECEAYEKTITAYRKVT